MAARTQCDQINRHSRKLACGPEHGFFGNKYGERAVKVWICNTSPNPEPIFYCTVSVLAELLFHHSCCYITVIPGVRLFVWEYPNIRRLLYVCDLARPTDLIQYTCPGCTGTRYLSFAVRWLSNAATVSMRPPIAMFDIMVHDTVGEVTRFLYRHFPHKTARAFLLGGYDSMCDDCVVTPEMVATISLDSAYVMVPVHYDIMIDVTSAILEEVHRRVGRVRTTDALADIYHLITTAFCEQHD